MLGWRSSCLAAFCAAVAALGLGGGAAARAVLVEVTTAPGLFASDAEARAGLLAAARGADIEIQDIDLAAGTARVEASEGAVLRFLADPRFVRVEPAAGFTAPTYRRYRVQSEPLASAASSAGVVAALVVSDVAAASASGGPAGGAGEALRVVARGPDGAILAEAFVADPRVIRYEGIDGEGRFVSRTDVVDQGGAVDVEVVLPTLTTGVRLELWTTPGADGSAERLTATGELAP